MPTVRALIEVLAPALRLVGEDSDALDAEVTEVVLLGPGDPPADAPGRLLVCAADVPEVSAAAGLVVKEPPATSAAVPVLLAAEGLAWNHLLNLLSAAVDASGSSDAVGDLFALANAVAAAVGGAVAIEDPQRRVLAYSSLGHPVDAARREGILGRVVPHLHRNDALYRDLSRATGVLRFPADGEVLPRLAVAVRSGAELLGSIWVVEATPLDARAEQALLDSGRLAAVHLLRARAGSQVERRARGDILRGLLDGRAAPDLAGTRLGIPPGSPVTVLAFALDEQTAAHELAAESVADLVALQCSAVGPRASVLVQLGTAYALVPGEVERGRLRALAERTVERARAALQVELAAAVGATVPRLAQVADSRHDADVVLRLVPLGSAAAVEDHLAAVLLLELGATLDGNPRLRLPAVDAMLASDAEHDTPYAESVLAYLAANADIPTAAHAVNVHPNTFRYRLRRVRDLFGLDLDDPDVRLATWLLLRSRRPGTRR